MKNKSKPSEVKEVVQDFTGASLEVGTSMLLENLPELGASLGTKRLAQ